MERFGGTAPEAHAHVVMRGGSPITSPSAHAGKPLSFLFSARNLPGCGPAVLQNRRWRLQPPRDEETLDCRSLAGVAKVEGFRLVVSVVEGQGLASTPPNVTGVAIRGVRGADLSKKSLITKASRTKTADT